jgi:cobalamin synthase
VNTLQRPGSVSPRFSPLVGAAQGAAAGLVYWLSAQIWPPSIAVVLALLTSALLAPHSREASAAAAAQVRDDGGSFGALGPGHVLGVLLKYAALMALTSVKLPYALPPNVSLGFVLVAGHSISRALALSVPVSALRGPSAQVAAADLAVALALGAAPAALLGVPGLTGIAAALAVRIAGGAYAKQARVDSRQARSALAPEPLRQLTEVVFYLAALAARAFT